MDNIKGRKIKASVGLSIMGLSLIGIVIKKSNDFIVYDDQYIYITEENGDYLVHKKGSSEVTYSLQDIDHNNIIDGNDLEDICNTTMLGGGAITVQEVDYQSPGSLIDELKTETGRDVSYHNFRGYSNHQLDVCRMDTTTTLASSENNSKLLYSKIEYDYNNNMVYYKESRLHPIQTENGVVDVSKEHLTREQLDSLNLEGSNYDETFVNNVPFQLVKKQ